MKNKPLVISLVLVILLVAITLLYNFLNPNSPGCSNQNGYCVYEDVPAYLKYTKPSIFSKDDGITTIISTDGKTTEGIISEFNGNLSNYLIKYDSPSWKDLSKYNCVATGEKPVVINYYYATCEGFEGEGCGHERRAIICGDVYLVEDFTSSYGPRLYGPFPVEITP